MHDVILTSDDGNYRVIAAINESPESPRWDAEFGTMVCGHRRYDLGDRTTLALMVDEQIKNYGLKATVDLLVQGYGTTVVLPLYLHDHSGLSITAGSNLLDGGGINAGGWDSGFLGIIFDTAERRQDWAVDTTEMLLSEVKEYDHYLRGDAWVLTAQQRVNVYTQRRVTFPSGESEYTDETTTEWLAVDYVPGYSGLGDANLGSIAADMLNEILVEAPVSNH